MRWKCRPEKAISCHSTLNIFPKLLHPKPVDDEFVLGTVGEAGLQDYRAVATAMNHRAEEMAHPQCYGDNVSDSTGDDLNMREG